MSRLIAIGDVHGMAGKLNGLLGQIEPDPTDTFVFLGDYIDIGHESYQVIESILELQDMVGQVVTLRGNHEDFVLSLFQGNQDEKQRQLWVTHNGGRATMASYKAYDEYLVVHRDFYENLPLSFETDDYFFCHAGIRPGVPLDQQRASDLVGIREPFLSSTADHGKVIVHGHTRSPEPEVLPNRIGLDTGACHGGPLSAIELGARRTWQQR